jgi:type III pantothenate kinase
MSTLLVDIGNTRVKWAVLRGVRMSSMRASPHLGKVSALRAMIRVTPADVDQALAVCVAGSSLERALAAAVRERFGISTEFVRSTRRAGGVVNGYRDTWRLGADRWVGVIAAHAIARGRAALVVNAGTALTADLVTGDGRHLGGAIVPGPATMIESLLDGTAGIRRRARGGRGRATSGMYAGDTAGAIEAGARYAAAAFVDRALHEARAVLGRAPLALLSGGAALAVAPLTRSSVRLVPDLVLRGLAVLARG